MCYIFDIDDRCSRPSYGISNFNFVISLNKNDTNRFKYLIEINCNISRSISCEIEFYAKY